jgi:hypothetical protein
MPRSTVHFGNLAQVFEYGRSEMYSRIAQICVLYEDLKIETSNLFSLARSVDFDNVSEHSFEVLYYIRRSIASLMEYRGALGQLCGEEEFQKRLPALSAKHTAHIIEARDFFVEKHNLIKSLRNDIGGHFQFDYARHATANFPPEETGKIEWLADSPAAWSLNIDLAVNIVVAGLEKTLKPKTDAVTEFREMIAAIGEAYQHVQAATYALVYCFLWSRLRG